MGERNDDGGSAFPVGSPVKLVDGSYRDGHPGMTLRDYFAGQVMGNLQGTNPNLPDSPASGRLWPEAEELARRQATWAYLAADAMLAERSKP